MSELAISTWFVADAPGEETEFPQVGLISSRQRFQDYYWRCAVCFFASSRRFNPSARHVFFTNTTVPIVDGVAVSGMFAELGVEVVRLPITHRLPVEVSRSWGNQFYVLDIIKKVASDGSDEQFILLDSDCLWTASAQSMCGAIARSGCLTYTLGDEEYPPEAPINGVTRCELRQALDRWRADGGTASMPRGADPFLPYHGGEVFAATIQSCRAIAALIDPLWRWAFDSNVNAFREEAHFLSIIYGALGYAPYTAQPFIKRMWTNLKFSNVAPGDLALPIWHLPGEKKTGFTRLYRKIVRSGLKRWMSLPDAEYQALVRSLMGVPRRGPAKLCKDLSAKLYERAAPQFRH